MTEIENMESNESKEELNNNNNSSRKQEKRKLFSTRNKEALDCRMYENEWPEIGDVVLAVVKSIEETAAYCSLLEYNNLEGMMLLSELQRRRIRSVKRIIKVGRQEIVMVTKVNKDKGYIDLSRKRVTQEDRDRMDIKWNKSKAVHSIMKQVSTLSKFKYSVLDLYENFGWKMYDKFKHGYDGFKLAMVDKRRFLDIINDRIEPQSSIESQTSNESNGKLSNETNETNEISNEEELSNIIPSDVMGILFRVIEKRLQAKMVTVRGKIELTCFSKEGINGIKAGLKAGLTYVNEKTNSESNCVIRLIAPPDYSISMDTLDSEETINLLNTVINKISKEIKTYGGGLKIKEEPRVINLDIADRDESEIGNPEEDE